MTIADNDLSLSESMPLIVEFHMLKQRDKPVLPKDSDLTAYEVRRGQVCPWTEAAGLYYRGSHSYFQEDLLTSHDFPPTVAWLPPGFSLQLLWGRIPWLLLPSI